MKKVLALLFAAALVVLLALMAAKGQSTAKKGVTGECTYTLNGTVLTVKGDGGMGDYKKDSLPVWKDKITELIIKNGVKTVGEYAFSGCKSLKKITLPESIISVGKYSFYGCTSLKSVTVPANVCEIGKKAFYGCTALEKVSLADGINYLGDSTFGECTALVDFETESCPAFMGDGVFKNCKSLKLVTVTGDGHYVFDNTYNGCKELSQVLILNGIKQIGKNAFSGCDSLKRVIFVGTKKEWNAVVVESGNESLTGAAVYCTDKEYYSEDDLGTPETREEDRKKAIEELIREGSSEVEEEEEFVPDSEEY